jgi:hypothetical protein
MMNTPRIALFANKDSAQIAALRDLVQEEGAEPLVFDIQLGGESAPSFTLSNAKLSWAGIDFTDIKVAHIRCTALNTPQAVPPVLNVASYAELRAKYLREQEYQVATASFFERLQARGTLVINPLTGAYVDHDSKAQLYQKLRAAGFPAPRTLMTNDPARALAFVKEHGGQVVAKPSIGIGSTRLVTEADCERLDELKVCPVLMQECLRGSTVRVHVVADKVVLALRIISGEGQIDSRTSPQSFEYYRLPDDAAAKLVRATHFLGAQFAAWDILATNDGGYYYLDCNPGPYIMWIGDDNMKAVLRQLAVFMIAYARTESLAEAAAKVVPWRPSV